MKKVIKNISTTALQYLLNSYYEKYCDPTKELIIIHQIMLGESYKRKYKH